MKQQFFSWLLLLLTFGARAQGTVQLTGGRLVNTGGFLLLHDASLVNNGTITQTTGATLKFTGGADVSLSGTGSTTLQQLQLAKAPASRLLLNKPLSVLSAITFNGGLLDLDNSMVDLQGTGHLLNETESSRAIAGGTGYLQATVPVPASASVNPGNLGAWLTTPDKGDLGPVTIKRGHQPQTFVSGTAPSIQRTFDISAASKIGAKVTLQFHYFDAELNGLPESSLELWINEKGKWKNAGFANRDVAENFIEAIGVSPVSFWTLSPGKGQILVARQMPVEAEMTPENSLIAWPNPVANIIYIRLKSLNAGKAVLTLVDAKGAQVRLQQANLGTGVNNLQFNLSGLSNGSYYLRCTWGNTTKIIRLVKAAN